MSPIVKREVSMGTVRFEKELLSAGVMVGGDNGPQYRLLTRIRSAAPSPYNICLTFES
jgi:hypothetical protein